MFAASGPEPAPSSTGARYRRFRARLPPIFSGGWSSCIAPCSPISLRPAPPGEGRRMRMLGAVLAFVLLVSASCDDATNPREPRTTGSRGAEGALDLSDVQTVVG